MDSESNLDCLGQNPTRYNTATAGNDVVWRTNRCSGLRSVLLEFLGGARCFAVMVAESLQVAIPMQTSYKKGVLEAYVGRKHVLFGAAGNG